MTWSNTGGPPEEHPPKHTLIGNSKGRNVRVKGTSKPSVGNQHAETGPERARRLRGLTRGKN